jgi:hypothetical protein
MLFVFFFFPPYPNLHFLKIFPEFHPILHKTNQSPKLTASISILKTGQVTKEYTIFFFLILVCEAIGTTATPGLLCQPRVIVKMIVEKQMERRLTGEAKVLGENLPQRHFCPSQNPT